MTWINLGCCEGGHQSAVWDKLFCYWDAPRWVLVAHGSLVTLRRKKFFGDATGAKVWLMVAPGWLAD